MTVTDVGVGSLTSLLTTAIALLSFHRANKHRNEINRKEQEEIRNKIEEAYAWVDKNKDSYESIKIKIDIMYETWFRLRTAQDKEIK